MGADLVLYSVFRSLGVEVAILPILEKEGEYSIERQGIERQDLRIKDGGSSGNGYYSFVPKPLMKYLESGEAQKIREDETGPVAPGGHIKDLGQRWKRALMARRVSGLDELCEQRHWLENVFSHITQPIHKWATTWSLTR